MTTTEHTVHFSVAPGFYETHARGLMLEENWRGALSFLMDTLEGMTLDIAVDILKGNLALKTDGDALQTMPQDREDPAFKRFVSTYRWQHAGILKVDAEFFQPYGAVNAFGTFDEEFARTEILRDTERTWTPLEYRTLRAKGYARHRESDLVVFDPAGGAVLFRRIPGPAFWQPTFSEPLDALADFRRQRSLENLRFDHEEAGAEGNAQHWQFYVPALRLTVLRTPRWDETLLTADTLAVLESLITAQDAVLDAKWAATEEGSDEEEARDRFDEAVYRAEILERAKQRGGFIPLTVDDPYDGVHVVQVPAIPLLRWAMRNVTGAKYDDVGAWRPVCPSGLKMMGDNPMHTDWWVGAGQRPRWAYNHEHPLNKAAWNFALHLGMTRGQDFVKLAGSGRAFGQVVFPGPNEAVPEGAIAVVPYAGVDYEIAMLSACKGGRGAVISAVGGKLAHLATVARETQGRVVVVNDAMTAFKAGEFVTLDLDKMTLDRHQTTFGKGFVDTKDEL